MLTSATVQTHTATAVLSIAGDVDVAVAPELRAAIDQAPVSYTHLTLPTIYSV